MNTILYFSPTGNVKFVVEKLSDCFKPGSTELQPLEFADPATIRKNENLIIIYSIHAFNAPRTVKRFIRNIPGGLFKAVSLIAVGCAESWVNEAATSSLRRMLEKKGYSITVDTVMAMPLTFILSFPDETAKRLLASAEKKVESIADEIRKGEITVSRAGFKSKALTFIGKAEGIAARLFGLELHANKNCTSCGICVRNCPEKNIRFNNKQKPVFGLSCLMCMRCIYNCPEKAVSPRISKFIPIKGGYNISKYQDSASGYNGEVNEK